MRKLARMFECLSFSYVVKAEGSVVYYRVKKNSETLRLQKQGAV